MFFENAIIGKNSWWRYVLTAILTAFTLFILINIAAYAISYFNLIDNETLVGFNKAMQNIPNDISKTLVFSVVMGVLILILFIFLFFVKLIHKKPILSIITSRQSFDFKRFFISFGIFFILLFFASAPLYFNGALSYNYSFEKFMPLLLIALILVPLQSASEEIILRGYLHQAFGLLFKSKLVAFLLVIIVFTVMHFPNIEFETDFNRVLLDFLMASTLFGLIVVLDNGLEIAIGVHAANNVFAVLIVSISDGSINTDAIFSTTIVEVINISIWYSVAFNIMVFAIFYKIYNWKFSTLFEPIFRNNKVSPPTK